MLYNCHSANVCHHFRNTLQSETEKLTSHCLEWDRKLELDIPDDGEGTFICFYVLPLFFLIWLHLFETQKSSVVQLYNFIVIQNSKNFSYLTYVH